MGTITKMVLRTFYVNASPCSYFILYSRNKKPPSIIVNINWYVISGYLLVSLSTAVRSCFCNENKNTKSARPSHAKPCLIRPVINSLNSNSGKNMKLCHFNSSYSAEAIELYTNVFASSENEDEGRVIGELVSNLIGTTELQDLIGFVAISSDKIVGCIFFSRLIVPSNKVAFILSPVAIATGEQGKGIGQQLINYGLSYLKSKKIDFAFTYGDPSYYCKVGFSPISESVVKAPFKLSQPQGWLAQSLNDSSINALQGSSQCVEAFNNQAYW